MNNYNEKEMYGMGEILNSVFSNIDAARVSQGNDIINVWEETVQKIYNYGPKLVGHTRVVDLKNGVLLVETDHPGWNQILNTYKDFLIKGLKMKIKDLEISTLAFKVKGTSVALSESYEESKKRQDQELIEKLESNEKKLEEMGYKNQAEGEINPEIAKLFSGILGEK
ncbi:DUF721 domain-containing protein [Treponema sp.]|uniref:DUF721 domain-containing protein n=1 Tax=Treponema sp. TaxID=166 RepID=UPI00298E106E|nr:DUF721 domain-containing protein [Treponema sp.]